MTGADKVDLRTTYLGLELSSPIVASASPLTRAVEGSKALSDAGVGAVVLPSLFEEEIVAEEVGLSEAAVRRRVQRLKDSGVMQIVAITDPLLLGYGREALIGIRVHGDVRLVADKIAAIDEANYVVMTAGSFDIIAEVIAEDDNDLVHLLNDSIRSIPGVTEVETFLYLKLAKQTYTWGTK